MRSWPSVLAACGLVACGHPPVRQHEFPTLELGETYNTRIANLRTTLARSGISLRVAGTATSFETADCTPGHRDPTKPFGGCVRCDLAGESSAVDGAVLEATTQAFQRYPTAVLDAANIDHVAMCTNLDQAGEKAGMEHPAGVADVHGRGMLISLSYFLNRTYYTRSDFTVDDITHHELFHLLEFQKMEPLMLDDPEWMSANPPGWVYNELAAKNERVTGFVNSYAGTNPVEDKASVYEFLMVHSDDLCDLARTDETVKAKATIIWKRVVAAVGTDSFLRAAAPCVDWI